MEVLLQSSLIPLLPLPSLSGNILFSADSEGQYFNIFHISPNLLGSTECKVNHLYTLYRGTTTGIVREREKGKSFLCIIFFLFVCPSSFIRFKMLVSLMTVDGVQYPLVMEPLISSLYHLMEVRKRRRERERERERKSFTSIKLHVHS